MNKQEYLAKKEKEARENNNSSACEWITVDELQSKLKISRSTVYRWIKNSALRAYRFEHSRNLYFLNEEVDRFLSLNPIAPSGRLDKLGLLMGSNHEEAPRELKKRAKESDFPEKEL